MADTADTIVAPAGQALVTLSDLNTIVNHEPRIEDLRLGEALGFERPRVIKDLIQRHRQALEQFGEVCRTVRQTSEKGGRPGRTFWLNKRQCLYLCTKSETPNATEVTIRMVEVFDEHLRGTLTAARATPARARHRKPQLALAAGQPGEAGRHHPRRFAAGSDLQRDLLLLVRSAQARMAKRRDLDLGRALAETLEDLIAKAEDPAAVPRGPTLDWNRDRATEDLHRKMRAEGKEPGDSRAREVLH